MLQDYFSTKQARWAVWALGALVLAFLIFHAGVAIGRRSSMHGPGRGAFIPHGHGAVGTVGAVHLPTFVLQEKDGDEETVTVSSSTIIEGSSASSTIVVGEAVVVLGTPNESGENTEQIDAKFIRIVR
jgi:hypothetical protein